MAERAFYIMATAQEGWSRDVMLLQVANGYIHAKGNAINNFDKSLPPLQSDLAKYTFKDPYNFSFLGIVALQLHRPSHVSPATSLLCGGGTESGRVCP